MHPTVCDSNHGNTHLHISHVALKYKTHMKHMPLQFLSSWAIPENHALGGHTHDAAKIDQQTAHVHPTVCDSNFKSFIYKTRARSAMPDKTFISNDPKHPKCRLKAIIYGADAAQERLPPNGISDNGPEPAQGPYAHSMGQNSTHVRRDSLPSTPLTLKWGTFTYMYNSYMLKYHFK